MSKSIAHFLASACILAISSTVSYTQSWKRLFTNRCLGVEVPVGPNQKVERSQAMVLCVTTDLPAKAKLLNFMQFNGEYGCTVCKHKGKVVAVGAGRSRVYKNPRTPAPPLRSHEDCLALGKRALQTKKVCGYIRFR